MKYHLQRQKLTGRDSSKAFLASSIPDLQFDSFSIKIDGPYLKVNAEE